MAKTFFLHLLTYIYQSRAVTVFSAKKEKKWQVDFNPNVVI